MRVILIQDVPRVGSAGEVKDVADGYGRNFLIPQGLAEFVSPEGLKMAEGKRKIEEKRQLALNAEMAGLAQALEGLEVSITAKVGEQERLYGSVTSADIAEAAQKLVGQDIDKRKIELDEPIHQLGEYEVVVRLSRDLVPKLKVVVAEEETGAKSKEKASKQAEVEVEGQVEAKPKKKAAKKAKAVAEVEAKPKKKAAKKAKAEAEVEDKEPEAEEEESKAEVKDEASEVEEEESKAEEAGEETAGD